MNILKGPHLQALSFNVRGFITLSYSAVISICSLTANKYMEINDV